MSSVDMDQEEVARQVASYNLFAIPVVDKDGVLVGIITVDDVVDVIREEATEDMLKMAGAVEEDAVSKSSSVAAAKVGCPGCLPIWSEAYLSGAILWEFRYTIQEVVAIVSFIPVIAAMGGNVGLQSSTLIIRGLATGLVEVTDVWNVFFREVKIGLLMGVACGVILSLVGWIWHQGFLGVVVGVSLITAFLVSTSMATFMPIVLKADGRRSCRCGRTVRHDGERHHGHHHLSHAGHHIHGISPIVASLIAFCMPHSHRDMACRS